MQLSENTPSQRSLDSVAQTIKSAAESSQEDPAELLEILRFLENLHRNIRDNYFLGALPANRQALYALLRDIEQNGGWPYIPRFKLQELLNESEQDIHVT